MVGQHLHQIILQKTICTAGRGLVSRHMRKMDVSLLGEPSLLRKFNEVGFALLGQPGVRHGDWQGPGRASVAIRTV